MRYPRFAACLAAVFLSAGALAAQAAPRTLTLMAVGDIMLGRGVGRALVEKGPVLPFAKVVDAFKTADIVAGNLECVVSSLGKPQPKAYRLRAPLEAIESLAGAGIAVVNLANNHAMDFGYVATADMRRRLAERGIASVGVGDDEAEAHTAVIVERGGLRVAFLGYVDVPVEGSTHFDASAWTAGTGRPGLAWAESSRIAEDVREAKKSADVVVVFLHSGLEGVRAVTSAQMSEARAAIDAGAALVLGAHPHILQRAELYHGGLIAYSLGNFVFDGFAAPENYSAVLSVSLSAAGVVGYEWLPMVVENGLPRPAVGKESAAVLALLK